jgi:NADPH2:quinone reductase
MAIGTAGFTAALAIHQLQRNGQTPELGSILVSGASGGVGNYAIDLLTTLGYEVVAVSNKKKQSDYLYSLGASKILPRDALQTSKKPLQKGMGGGAIDTVGGELLSGLTRTVKPLGNIAVIGLTGGIAIETTVMPFILRGINLLGINSVYCSQDLKIQIWNRLAGDLKPKHIDRIVTSVITMDQLSECFNEFILGQHYGRTVVKISE